MANLNLQATITAKDTASGVIEGFNKSLGGLKGAATGVGVGLLAIGAAATAFGVKSVQAYNASVEAGTKLKTNLLNVKGATMENVDSLKRLANQLQNLGVIEADVIEAGMSQLATFNLQGKTIETLTPKITDMVAQLKGHNATAEDMVGINNLVGKVMTGSVGALTRYGVTLDDNQAKILANGSETEKAAKLVEVLSQNYGKVNEALRNTPEGRITGLKNAFGDFQDLVGAAITSVIDPVVKKFEAWLKNIGGVEGAFKLLGDIIKFLNGDTTELLERAKEGDDTFGKLDEKIGWLNESIFGLQATWIMISSTVMAFWRVLKDQLIPVWNELKAAVEPILPTLKMFAEFIGVLVIGVCLTLIAVISGVITFIAKFLAGIVTAISGVIQFCQGFINFLTGVFMGDMEIVTQGLMEMWNGIKNFIMGLWDAIIGSAKGFCDSIIGFFKNLFDELIGHSIIPDLVNGIIDWFAGLPGRVLNALVGLADIISKPFRDGFDAIKNFWNNTVGGKGFAAPSWLKKMGVGDFKFPKFMNGTNYAPGGMAMVGEDGPEAVYLPRGSKVLPSNRAGGSGMIINNYNTFIRESDPIAFARELGFQLAR